jgi:hypothetical protein
MKILALILFCFLFLMVTGLSSYACGIEGSATRTDGSKVNRTARVSTSWNSSDTFPSDGRYSLDLGSSACGESVEVFVNGYSLGRKRIPNSGNARVDFVLKGSSDTPVR